VCPVLTFVFAGLLVPEHAVFPKALARFDASNGFGVFLQGVVGRRALNAPAPLRGFFVDT